MYREDPLPGRPPVWGYLAELPTAELPRVEFPSLEIPSLEIPSLEIPGLEIPRVGISRTGGCGEHVNANRRRPGRWELPARRAVDLTVALVALVLLAAPMIVVAVTIRLASRGPALFRQRRIGQDGVPFTMYKFRTMQVGCSDEAHRELIARELRGEDTSADGSWKLHADSRLVPFGDWLRRTSVDELPQLFNVVLGQMALVGPRPCLDWEAELFPPRFSDRFTVRPGITGLWQVEGRSTMGTLDMLELDIAYARDWGFWSDLRILARTMPTLLRGQGAR